MSERPTDLDRAVAAWDVEGAPASFADRVLAAADAAPAEPARARGSRHRRWPFAAVGAVAAAALLALWIGGRPPTSGELSAVERTTLRLQGAIAVAEPGTALSWSADDDALQIRQDTGRAFYRVDAPASVSVVTPLGRVSAVGTAFEVEIEPMRRHRREIASMAAGIAVSAAVIVTLYEGKVVVASDGGEATLRPGQSARLVEGRAPETSERESLAALRQENDRLHDELRAERERNIGRAEAPASPTAPEAGAPAVETTARDEKARIEKCATTINGGPGCPMVDPSPEVLERRADCGIVVYDRPRALESGNVDFTEMADLVGLDDEEVAQLEEASRSFHEHMREELAVIHEELGGDRELGAKLSVVSLAGEIERLLEQAGPGEHVYEDAAVMYSAVLAGRREAPQLRDLPPGQRHGYIWTASGDLYEAWLAERIGAERARELRAANDGWLANRGMQGMPRCPED